MTRPHKRFKVDLGTHTYNDSPGIVGLPECFQCMSSVS